MRRAIICISFLIFTHETTFAADKAYDLNYNPSANQRSSPDYYVGIMGGTSTGSNINGQDINIPLLGGGKAGVYFNKYIGVEISGLMAPMGGQYFNNNTTTNQSTLSTTTTPAHSTTTTTTTTVNGNGGMDQTFCNNYECNGTTVVNGKGKSTVTTVYDVNEGNANGVGHETFQTTKTVTTYPVTSTTQSVQKTYQNSSYQQNFTLNIEAAMLMLRMPFAHVSFYMGAGPALVNTPNMSIGAVSGKIGAEVPFGIIGVFGEEQVVTFPSGQQHDTLGMALGGINVHF